MITKKLDENLIATWDGFTVTVFGKDNLWCLRLSPRAQVKMAELFEEIVAGEEKKG